MALSLIPRRSPPPPTVRSLPDLPGFEVVASILDRLVATAQVGLAYGEPLTMDGRTIIPVGAVSYGFGGGFGGGSAEGKGHRRGRGRSRGTGGGGGGGVMVQPIALIELTRSGTKVRPILDWTRIIVLAAGLVVPLIFRRWRRRSWKDVQAAVAST